jgi:hypothetical protein
MRRYPSDIAFTPAVKKIQVAKGSRAGYARVEWGQGWETNVTPELAEFLAGLDMFYWDMNCPQHIHKRYSQRQVEPIIVQLQQRIGDLEKQLAEARDQKSPAS